MARTPRPERLVGVLLAMVVAPTLAATVPTAPDHPIRQFLAQDDTQHPYRAARRLEAHHRGRTGWIEAATEYAPATGFRYRITAEGGSSYIRSKVLTALLDAEHEVIARGETGRSSLAPANYEFQTSGVDAEGLAKVLLFPRRKERVLVAGAMFLHPNDGELVRLQGRLARSPSFWIKHVDIVREYARIDDVVVPVSLETTAQMRFLGEATLRMIYVYSEIDGQPVAAR